MSSIETPPLASETIFHLGSFEIRNTLIMAWLAVGVIFVIAWFARRTRYREIPGRFQTLLEMIVEGLFDFFSTVIGDRKQTRTFFPLIATIFLFLMLANWMGIFPGVGSITIPEAAEGRIINVPIFRSMNADVNMTLAIALISVVSTQLFGIAALGVMPYANKFFVAPWRDPIGSFVGILELIAELAKVISFSFRLFGNIFAGGILIGVLTFFVPYILPAPFMVFEMFVGLLQGVVFSLLTLFFVKMALTKAEH